MKLCAIHAKWVTITLKDMQLARCIRGKNPLPIVAPSNIEYGYLLIKKVKGKS